MITTNSLGKRIAKTDEQIRAFWRWFGESKVVDKRGRPLVLYHNTKVDFNIFSSGKRKRGAWGAGFYFAQSPEKNAREKYGDRTIACYLRIINPAMKRDVMAALDETDGKKEPFSLDLNRLVAVHLRRNGFDGVRMPVSIKEIDWVSFRPDQIKSIHNRGTFDPNDPVITNPRTWRNPMPKHPPKRINLKGTKRLRIMAPMARVYSVSGSVVRNQWADWIGGSHHAVDAFVPKGEIWIERGLGSSEGSFVLAHEMIEKLLMDYLHWSYEKAHAAANDLETDLRCSGTTLDRATEIFAKHLAKHFNFGHPDHQAKLAAGMARAFMKY